MPTIDQIEKFNELNSLQAAMVSPAMKPIIRLLASADVTLQGKVSVHELDRKLAGSRLSPNERMLVKTGLHHAGLLD